MKTKNFLGQLLVIIFIFTVMFFSAKCANGQKVMHYDGADQYYIEQSEVIFEFENDNSSHLIKDINAEERDT